MTSRQQFCECGNPTAVRTGGDWICERCARMQSEMRARELRVGFKQKVGTGVGMRRDWDDYWTDQHRIAGGSLAKLEATLKAIGGHHADQMPA